MSAYNLAKEGITLGGRLDKSHEMNLKWLPDYIDNFPEATQDITLSWDKCKFVKESKCLIPEKHGVYCFSTTLGKPFPDEIHLILYIGKAAPKYLSERFNDYLKERNSPTGREKVVYFLNKYKNNLFFWWSSLPRIHVDTVEEHLLMCCCPPGNSSIPSREKLWGRAFE